MNLKSLKNNNKDLKNVLVAFSGGPDSRFLLNFLLKNRENFGIEKIACAHMNHNLRGEESDRDEKFVRAVCKNLNLEIFVKSLDIHKISIEEKRGLEEVARSERYKFFAEICEKENFDFVAVAHNSTDNLETIIFNLIRGSKNPFKGIQEIQNTKVKIQKLKNKNRSDSENFPLISFKFFNLSIWRPILKFSKKEILKFLEKEKIEFVLDSSNFSLDYSRNKIRHKILPVLEEINPSVEKNIYKNSIHFSEIEKLENEKNNLIVQFLKKDDDNEKKEKKDKKENLDVDFLENAEFKILEENFNLKIFLSFSSSLQKEILHFMLKKISQKFEIRLSTELINEIVKFLKSENGKKMEISRKKIEKNNFSLYFFKTHSKFRLQIQKI